MKFYESHVNFNCKVIRDPEATSKVGIDKMLVKEAVAVNVDTHPLQKAIDVI